MRLIRVLGLALPLGVALVASRDVSASGDLLTIAADECYGAAPKSVTFTPTKTSYTFGGACDLTQTRAHLPITVPWTATASYEPATGRAIEDIIVPPPLISQPSRLYGTFHSSMHCAADPWVNASVTCDQVVATANAPLDHTGPNAIGYKPDYPLEPYILGYARQYKCPFTSFLDDAPRAALLAQYKAALAAEKKREQIQQVAADPKGAEASSFLLTLSPTVLSPTAGQGVYDAQPVSIRIAPPKGVTATGYTVNLERKDTSGRWIAYSTFPVGGAQAQSPAGYTGFGAGAPPAYLSIPGSFRIKAQVSSPKVTGFSDWVEFVVHSHVRVRH
jgi:hypothetical protein